MKLSISKIVLLLGVFLTLTTGCFFGGEDVVPDEEHPEKNDNDADPGDQSGK